MALTLYPPETPQEAITVDDYMDFVARELDAEDDDSLYAPQSVAQFSRLLANPGIVTAALNRELARLPRSLDLAGDFSGTSVLLGRAPSFLLRANFWTPPSHSEEAYAFETYFNQYQMPHNHRFSFLTGGYYGGGYETIIYQYEGDEGYLPGDPVALTFSQVTQLPKGKLMFYYAVRDVHAQRIPLDPSISLNLVAISKKALERPTVLFDLEKKIVTSIALPQGRNYEIPFLLAEQVGDARTVDALEEIAVTHPHPMVRGYAFRAISRMCPNDAQVVVQAALKDRHPYVRDMAACGFPA